MDDTLRTQWYEHNQNWGSIGYPEITYEDWLESQVIHWQKCAKAKFGKDEDKMLFSVQDMTDNLQQRVNELEAENRDLKRKLEDDPAL